MDKEYFSEEAREIFAEAEFPRGDLKSGLSVGSRLPLSHQDKAIAELHETINQLAQRLKPVLTPVKEVDKASNGEEARDIVSPLAEQLATNNGAIHRASRNLRGLMERLEC